MKETLFPINFTNLITIVRLQGPHTHTNNTNSVKPWEFSFFTIHIFLEMKLENNFDIVTILAIYVAVVT